MDASKPVLSSYRWVILIVAALAHCVLNICIVQPGGLAEFYFAPPDLVPGSLGFDPTQFIICMNAPFLTTGLFGLLFGSIADRRGVKFITNIGFILGAVGVILRFFAINGGDNTFLLLFASSFLMGFGLAGLNANAVKLFAAWFPIKQVTMLTGVYVAAATLGAGIALGMVPIFGSICHSLSDYFLLAIILLVAVTVLWLLLVRSRPAGVEVPEPEPMMEYIKIVSSKKIIWLAGIAAAIFIAFGTTQNSNLVAALSILRDADAVSAGLVGTLVNVAVIVGSLFWPWLAGVIGRNRIAVIGALLAAVCTVLALFVVPFGPITFVLYFLVGFGAGGGAPIVMSMPASTPGVGEKYAGAGGGLISTIMNLAAFILPSFIIVPLAFPDATQPATLFWVVAIGYILFAISLVIIPELGRKGKIWKESQQEQV